MCVWQTQLKWKFADLHKVSLRLFTCVLSQLTHTHSHTPTPRMQQLWPCIIRYLNSACGMPQHPLYWLNFHPAHSKEEGGGEGAGGGGGGAVGDVTNRQLALKIKSFSCLTRFRTCMERAGYMCEYSVRNTIQQPSSYPPQLQPLHQPQPQNLQDLQLQSKSQARRSHRAALGTVSNVSFMSMPRSPFPHSHSHCDSLLPFAFPFPFAPSICNCCSWVSISLLGRVISTHIASSLRQSIWLVVYAFVLHCEKKEDYQY